SGLIPLSREAIVQAIRLNGVAIDANIETFEWGRRTAMDRRAVELIAMPPESVESTRPSSIESLIDRRATFLESYQDAAYAQRYATFVRNVSEVEGRRFPGRTEISQAVAEALFKLMAYKDEYEVARLYTNGSFLKALREQFQGDFRLEFHLAPPFLA